MTWQGTLISSRWAWVLLVMVIMGSAASAADPMSRLETYQKEVKAKNTGVYEIGDSLYVHVRIKSGSGVHVKKNKYKAIMLAKDLLKRWAIDFSAKDRVGGDGPVPGIKAAVRILDSINADWRFGDWNFKGPAQEVSMPEKGWIVIGQIFNKNDVVAAIPASFCSPCPPPDTVFRYVRAMLPAALRKAPDKLNKDLMETEECLEQAHRMGVMISDYLKTSPRAEKIRQDVKRMVTPRMAVAWEEREADSEPRAEETVQVVTNVVTVMSLVTNTVERVETGEEEKDLGISREGKVFETTIVGDVEEVVETKTVTTVSKRIRRRTSTSVIADPLFGRLFLAGGEMPNQVVPQADDGRKAVAAFSTNSGDEGTKTLLQAALARNPGDKELWNLFGRMMCDGGDYVAALVGYRCAMKLDAHYGYALVNFAMTAKRLGFDKLALAYAIYARGITDDPWCVKNSEDLLLGR